MNNKNNEELVCMEKCPHLKKIQEVKLSELKVEQINDTSVVYISVIYIANKTHNLNFICTIENIYFLT